MSRKSLKLFNEFLRENNAASKFYVNAAAQNYTFPVNSENAYAYILESNFIWSKTPEGFDFWNKLSTAWTLKCEKENII
jgi:hypothetical protein